MVFSWYFFDVSHRILLCCTSCMIRYVRLPTYMITNYERQYFFQHRHQPPQHSTMAANMTCALPWRHSDRPSAASPRFRNAKKHGHNQLGEMILLVPRYMRSIHHFYVNREICGFLTPKCVHIFSPLDFCDATRE